MFAPPFAPRLYRHLMFFVLALSLAIGGATLIAQTATDSLRVHLSAAQAAGSEMWPGLVSNLCDAAEKIMTPEKVVPPAFQMSDEDRRNPADWYRNDPVAIFDNFYIFSTKGGRWGGTTVYALKTSGGIVLFDTSYDYAYKEEVDNGMRKVGLNPADVKAAFVTHGHGDHFGGAKIMQELYNTPIYASAQDWDLMYSGNTAGGNPPPPRRDKIATDGQKFTLGDTTVTVYLTPGHTDGTISFIFPVKIKGTTHMAALWGGTAISPATPVEKLKVFSTSVDRFRTQVLQDKVDIIVSNHEAFGRYVGQIDKMRANPNGPNPFVVGTDGVLRFLKVLQECAQANSAASMMSKK